MARVVRVHDGKRFLCAVLGKRGRLYTQYVSFGFPIKKGRLANRIADDAPDLNKGKHRYPVKQACNKLLKMGRNGNITKGARELLNEARAAA